MLDLAQKESARLNHFYVGAEHLFLAILWLENGLTVSTLEQMGHNPRDVRAEIYTYIGKGDDKRYWSGFPETPRAAFVLEAARQKINNHFSSDEYALLAALIEDPDQQKKGESVPLRVLRQMGISARKLLDTIMVRSGGATALLPNIIEGGEQLSNDEKAVLHKMFHNYPRVRIERYFTGGGYSGARVILVRPIDAEEREYTPVIVKLHQPFDIGWEKRQYEKFVRDRLPLQAARIEGEPVISSQLAVAGLKYIFIGRGEGKPATLGDMLHDNEGKIVASFIRRLYDHYRGQWWGEARPYTFETWQEYDIFLPPALTIEVLPDSDDDDDPSPFPVRPLDADGQWSRDGSVRTGELVSISGFRVVSVKMAQGLVRLVPSHVRGSTASRITLRGIGFGNNPIGRGSVFWPVMGRVTETRNEILLEQGRQLAADWDISASTLPMIDGVVTPLLNPIQHYGKALTRTINGTVSPIHGDLHSGNILKGPGGDPWLIDFELAREGHTLCDWALLELSLLVDYIAFLVPDSWQGVWSLAVLIDDLNHYQQIDPQHPLASAFLPLIEVREIVRACLPTGANMADYQAALALCALRAIGWAERPLPARRLAFVVSALAITALASETQPDQFNTIDGPSDTNDTSTQSRPLADEMPEM
jgi:hypothetical protein